jgi:acyl-CoA reductase-like NAD-dependent aldehyde dehydrogenase
MKQPRLLLHGEWIETGAWLPVIDPFNAREIARVPLGDTETINRAIESALRAFQSVRFTPGHLRAARLHAVARAIEARKTQFAETIVSEAGKPISYAEAEVARAVMTFTAAAEEARRQHGEVLDMDAFPTGEGHIGFTRRFPIGVIAGITPFNFPLNLVAHKVAPAIATNNCIIVKPRAEVPVELVVAGRGAGGGRHPARSGECGHVRK